MNKKTSYYALEQVAKKHGVPADEVMIEIERALGSASVQDNVIKEMSAMEAVTYFRDLIMKRLLE